VIFVRVVCGLVNLGHRAQNRTQEGILRYYVDYLLSDEQRAALAAAEIDFAEMTLGTPAFHRHGVSFPDDDLEVVLDILHLIDDNENSERLETPQGDYVDEHYLLDLVEMPTADNPFVCSLGQRREDTAVYNNHQAELRHGLLLRSYDHGYAAHRRIPGVLVINTHCSPVRNTGGCGSRFASITDGCRLTAEGLGNEYSVLLTPEGEPMAAFRGDADGGSLWMLFQPNEVSNPAVVDYILYWAARQMFPELGEAVSLTEYNLIAARERYVLRAGRQIETEIREIGDRVSDAMSAVERARSELVDALRRADASCNRREELTSRDRAALIRELSEHLDREMQGIGESPDFESVEFVDDTIMVGTRPLLLRHEGRVYQLGRFTIEIGRRSLRINSRDGLRHPHVTERGGPCLGNISEGVARMQAAMQYGPLLTILMRYLEYGYNPGDSYIRIENINAPSYAEGEEPAHDTAEDSANTPEDDADTIDTTTDGTAVGGGVAAGGAAADVAVDVATQPRRRGRGRRGRGRRNRGGNPAEGQATS
jgi:hypothetical protein